MKKKSYYLWKNEFATEEALAYAKEKYQKLGFRVVIFSDEQKKDGIHDALKEVIRNHL